MHEHSKNYIGEEEELYRLSTFIQNYKKIQKHNQEGQSYTMAVNQFADLVQEEFIATFLGLREESVIGYTHEELNNLP